MLALFIIIFVAVNAEEPANAAVDVGDRWGPGFNIVPDLNDIPFTVVIYSPTLNKFGGCGIAISEKYMLTSAYVAKRITKQDYFAYDDILDPRTLNAASTPRHKIIRIKIHENYQEPNNMKYNIALIRPCEHFTSTFATLPSASQTYPLGTIVNAYIYDHGVNQLRTAVQTIVDDVGCVTAFGTTYDPTLHYCTRSQSTNHIVDNVDFYKNSFILLNGNFIGSVVKDTAISGLHTPIIRLEKFAAWITEKTS